MRSNPHMVTNCPVCDRNKAHTCKWCGRRIDTDKTYCSELCLHKYVELGKRLGFSGK